MKEKSNLVFISWATHCSRSDSIAKRLGGSSYMVYSPIWRSSYLTILFKYISQTFKTLRILFREKPRIVFVMTPPVISCFPVWLYTILMKASYAIDAHTGAFLDPRWQSILFLHRVFSNRAITTLVTNRYLEGIVRAWGADAKVVSDVPIHFANPSVFTVNGECNMTFVSSFTNDEPLELFLMAAETLHDIQFFVTGSFEDADPKILKCKPANVEFTGFLPDSKYVGLLMASDAIICLTKADHTMQRGAYEAIYLEKPIITSNFEVLRENFYKGAVYVDMTVEDVARGIIQMRDNIERYREEARALRIEKLDKWRSIEIELGDLLYGGFSAKQV